nr:alpha/beta hydrolase [Pseudomonas sp.]
MMTTDIRLSDSYANANGVRLHYVAAGKPENPLLLFLHGFPEHCMAWRNILPEFAADWYAVAVDLPGYNLSDVSTDVSDYRAGAVARTLGAFVDALGHRECLVVGHDWGGAIGWYMAATRPDMLRAFVAINAVHPTVFAREFRTNPAQRAASEYIGLFQQPDAEERLAKDDFAYLLGMFADESGRPEWLTAELQTEYLQAWRQPAALTGGLAYYRATSAASAMPQKTPSRQASPSMNVDIPVLVIWGEKDKFLLPSNLQGLEQYVKQLTVERLPEASHWVVHEFPGHVARLIREFVQQHGRRHDASSPKVPPRSL